MPESTLTEPSARARELAGAHRGAIHRRTDRMFAGLLAFQWVAMVALALWVAPYTWAGGERSTHPHVWAAVALGGAVVAFPLFLVAFRPGRANTRFVIAAAQMLCAALLIHLCGGRLETHFHVFGSLAFLALYRDWRVLLVASAVTAADHVGRGALWPESVYGTAAGTEWRWVEHAGWVVFMDLFLGIACWWGERDVLRTAQREAELEAARATVEERVRERTAELWQKEEQFRRAFDDAATGMALVAPEGRFLRVNRSLCAIVGYPEPELLALTFQAITHPDDLAADQAQALRTLSGEIDTYQMEKRYRHKDGRAVWALLGVSLVRDAGGRPAHFVAQVQDISERKRAEQELAAATGRMRLLLDSSGEGIYGIDTNGDCTFVNRAAAEFLGYEPNELVGRNMHEALQYAHRYGTAYPVTDSPIFKSLSTGTCCRVSDEVFWRKCGTAVPVEYSAFPMVAGDAPVGAVVTFRDISVRKQQEEALRASEDRYRTLATHSPVGIFQSDRTGARVYHNQRWCELTGMPAERAAGDGWVAAVHPDDRDRVVAAWDQVRTGGGSDELEYRFVRPTGETVWVLGRTVALPSATGATDGYIGIVADVSALKSAEKDLERTRIQLLDAIESLDAGFVMYDADERLVTCNTRYREMYAACAHAMTPGTPYETILRTFCANGGHAASGLTADAWVANRLADHRTATEPTEQRLADRWVRISDRRTHDGGTVSLRTDITALKKAQEEAEAANRSKSEFLANMSHEIRTPMNGIIGMTDLVLETDLTADQRESIGLVKSSADALLSLINDILDFSKIEAGKLDLDPLPFSVRDAVGDTLKVLAGRAHAKGLELACDAHPDVPDLLVGDPHRLRQVLTNLVGNAIKFTDRGEVVVWYERVRDAGDAVRLQFRVKDTGIGIPADKVRAIFEAFTQADGSTTRKYGGTGLGLTICVRLVEMMGGRIWAESELGKGSTFVFEVRMPRANGSLERAVEVPVDLTALPVLIVDDNATNRRVLAETVRQWGARPTCAATGPEALDELRGAVARGEPFPLVLLDGMMPDMDGFAVAERIGREPAFAGAAVVMLTSADRQGDAARCRALGLAAYLVKPVKPAELTRAIKAALADPSACAIGRASLHGRARVAPGAPAAPGGPAPVRPLRILLAEDNAVNQRVAVRLLGQFGHTVTVAGDGKQALAALARETFDVILMDVQMPEMDGFEATAAIRKQEAGTGRRLPVVAMTAHAMKGDRERCLAAGMDEYITKPVQRSELVRVLAWAADRPAAAQLPASAPAPAGGATPAPAAAPVPVVPVAVSEPTPPPRAQAPAFDRASAVERLGGDEELFAEVAALFQSDARTMLSDIRRAVATGDAPAVHRAAHGLKGAAGYVGGKPAAETAAALERIGASGDLADAPHALDMLVLEIDRLTAALAGAAAAAT